MCCVKRLEVDTEEIGGKQIEKNYFLKQTTFLIPQHEE